MPGLIRGACTSTSERDENHSARVARLQDGLPTSKGLILCRWDEMDLPSSDEDVELLSGKGRKASGRPLAVAPDTPDILIFIDVARSNSSEVENTCLACVMLWRE